MGHVKHMNAFRLTYDWLMSVICEYAKMNHITHMNDPILAYASEIYRIIHTYELSRDPRLGDAQVYIYTCIYIYIYI